MSIPIFTSIPPVFSRKDATGAEIGDAYLRTCIQSWKDCGFSPVTVNSIDEAAHPLIEELNIDVVRVPRDAKAITGRPHVYLADILGAAYERCGKTIFLINADIELDISAVAQARLSAMNGNDALLAHRRDHSGEKSGAQATYDGGIDLFAFSRELIDGLDCGDLVFGMPWWDHFLPLMLQGAQAKFVDTSDIALWHLCHGGRWDKMNHIKFGKEFLKRLKTSDKKFQATQEIKNHITDIENAERGATKAKGFRALKARLLSVFFSKSIRYETYVLREVGLLNEVFLNRLLNKAARNGR